MTRKKQELWMDQIKLVNILEEKTKKRLETLRELPILLTEKEVAQYFEISSSILAQWRIQGEGPSYHKIVGGIRYGLVDLLDYIESCKRHSTSK